MKSCLIFFSFCCVLFCPRVALSAESTSNMPALTLEELAKPKTLQAIERFAADRKLEITKQTREQMRLQKIPDLSRAEHVGAAGRVWMVFLLKSGQDEITVHASFFYRKNGDIISRLVLLEENNNP